MIRCALLLLCLQGLLLAVEIEVDLPDPAVIDISHSGWITLKNLDVELASYEIEDDDAVQLEIDKNQVRQQTEIVNGQASKSVSLGLRARFSQLGKQRLPTITFLDKDGNTYTSPERSITVDKPRSDLQGEVVCRVRLEPAEIVPGQTCTLAYELAVNLRNHVRFGQLNGANLPDDAIELGETEQSEGHAFDTRGQQWRIFTIRKSFTMSSPGSFRIGGQQSYLSRRGNQTVPVKPATLTVVPLPSEGRPEDFTNIIGAVRVCTSLDRSRIALGEGAVLSLSMEGPTLGLVDRPTLPVVDGLQAYPRDDDDQSSKNQAVFRWDLVPEHAGSYDLPSFSLPWFDPESRSYKRSRSDPLLLTVIPGRQRDLQVHGSLPSLDTGPVEDIPDSQMPEPIGAVAADTAGRWRIPLIALIGLGLGLALGLGARLRERGPRKPGALERCRHALSTGDLAAANQALAELLPKQRDPEQRRMTADLLTAVESARFGDATDHRDLARQAAELREP